MFYRIKEGKLHDWADRSYADDCLFLEDITAQEVSDNKNLVTIENNVLISLKNTEGYTKCMRLSEIEKLLLQATIEYETYLDTPVLYSNSFTYKPSYANDYLTALSGEELAKKINSTLFPRLIKDSTKLENRQVEMTYTELLQLTLYLADLSEKAWKIKADKEAILLAEKNTLL